MNHEAMLENIKAELDRVDPSALQSILEIIDRSKRKRASMPASAGRMNLPRSKKVQTTQRQFAGENLTLEEYERLTPKERGMMQRRLKEENHDWLHESFSVLRAAWLVVVDGKVFASGKSLDDLPLASQNVEVSQRTGKFPFVFINDDYMAIEESASAWHATNEPGDFYPTISITLNSDSKTAEIVGDFDTGASHTLIDYDFLLHADVVESLDSSLH